MVVVTNGLNELRTALSSYIGYLGIGESATAVATGDYAMNGELYRTVAISTDTTQEQIITKEFCIGASLLNGYWLRELSLFKGDATLLEDGEAVADWTAGGDAVLTADAVIYKIGSASMKIAITHSTGTSTAVKATSMGSLAAITGINSGTPLYGWVTIWVYITSKTNISTLKYRIGSDSSNYMEATLDLTGVTEATWYFWKIPLASQTKIGTPDWTAVDYQYFIATTTGNANVYIDQMSISYRMIAHSTIPETEKTLRKEITVNYGLKVLGV